MMNRRTIGWIVAIALGASGTALADTQNTRSQSQRTTRQPSQQSDQQSQQMGERTNEKERSLEQQTRETTVGAPKPQEREASDVPSPGAGEETRRAAEPKPSTAMRLEDRLEAIRLTALDKEEAVEVQTKLQDLGYYKGSVDGIVGRQTRAALQRYFRDQAALASRGMLGSAAAVSLGIDESAIQRVRGREQEPRTEPSTPRPEPQAAPPATTPPERMEPYPTPEHRPTPDTGRSGPR